MSSITVFWCRIIVPVILGLSVPSAFAAAVATCEECKTCSKTQGQPSVSEEGDQGFEANFPAGSTGQVDWSADDLEDGVTLDSLVFPEAGVSSHQEGGRRQVKSADFLVDAEEGSGQLVVKIYGAGQLLPGALDGEFDDMGAAVPDKEVVFLLGADVLQLGITDGGVPQGLFELETASDGTRVWTDAAAGHRISTEFEETVAGEVRVIEKEEWRKKLAGEDYELTSRIRETYRDRGDGFLLEESVNDPADPDRANAANLVTSHRYLGGLLARTLRPDGSWRIVARSGMVPVVDGNGDVVEIPDTNFPNWSADGIDEVTYSGWLDAAMPAGVPALASSVAEVTRVEAVSGAPRWTYETHTAGVISAKWDRLTTQEQVGQDYFKKTLTRNWNSSDPDDYLTREEWIHDTLDERPHKTINSDGTIQEYAYEWGTYTEEDGFQGPSGAFLKTTVTEAGAALTSSETIATREVRIEDPDGELVERKLDIHLGGGVYETMLAETWSEPATHPGERWHFQEDIARERGSADREALMTFSQSAGGPKMELNKNASGEIAEATENYSAAEEGWDDVVTTYQFDGRKRIVTRSAADLSETTVTEYDVAGRVVAITDERDILTTTGYANGGLVVTTARPGGVTRVSTRYVDGQEKSLSGTGVVPSFWEHSVAGNGFRSTTHYVGTTDNTSVRWSTRVTDWDGRLVENTRPSPAGAGTVTETRDYDPQTGRLAKIAAPGMADRLYEYDELGRVASTGFDLGGTAGQLDLDSVDRVTRTIRGYVKLDNRWWEQTTTRHFHTDNDDAAYYESVSRTSVAPVNENGGARWTAVSVRPGGLTLTTHHDEFLATATVVESTDSSATTASPDSVTTAVAGRVTEDHRFGAGSDHASSFGYDALGRQTHFTDPRGGITRTMYNAAGQATHFVDHALNTTEIDYYPADHQSAGLQHRMTNPESESGEYAYDALGRLTGVGGGGTYPLTYAYDVYGDLHTLTTYASGGAGEVTTWQRDPATGVVEEKIYPDAKGTTYTYHPTGRVHTRTWERGVTSTYDYSLAGALTDIDYSDSTPDVAIIPDRLGRPRQITDGGGTMIRSYDPALPAETTDAYDPAHTWLPGVTVDRAWTAATAQRLHTGAKRGLTGNQTWDQKADILHDPVTGRLQRITGPGFAHRYSYATGTDLITGIEHRDTTDSETFAEEIRRRDLAGRLYSIETRDGSGDVLQRHGYRHDKAGRRVRATREDGSYWAYGYNDRGEVTSGKKHLPDATLLAGQQFEYDYDALGNRNWAKSGGDDNGDNLRTVSYETNSLNQYTEIETPGSFDVIGRAPDNDTVTVNGQPTLPQGERFRAEVSADNSASAVWNDVTVSAGTHPDIEGSRYVPKATVDLEGEGIDDAYDDDGNLLFDGRWDYVWDAENRLVSMTTRAATQATGEPFRRLVFGYDGMSRRIRKQVFDSDTATAPVEDLRFAYDGWNLLAEYQISNGEMSLLRGYTWGTDLSGTEQGAGGVGGLLSVRSGISHHATSYDGNGNIDGWVGTDGQLAARQEYDPFGNRIIREGILDHPIGFSTKYRDRETGLLYYGYRYLDPAAGRWLGRDLIEEEGGVNLYSFVSNNGASKVDYLGLEEEITELSIGHTNFPSPKEAKMAPWSKHELGKNKNGEKLDGVLLRNISGLYTSVKKGDRCYPASGLVVRLHIVVDPKARSQSGTYGHEQEHLRELLRRLPEIEKSVEREFAKSIENGFATPKEARDEARKMSRRANELFEKSYAEEQKHNRGMGKDEDRNPIGGDVPRPVPLPTWAEPD